MQTDAAGIPVGLAVPGANVLYSKLLQETIEDCIECAVGLVSDEDKHMCLDKGYNSAAIRQMIETAYGYIAHVRSRGEEQRELGRKAGERPRRWVVERTHEWLKRFRAILIRWDKKSQTTSQGFT